MNAEIRTKPYILQRGLPFTFWTYSVSCILLIIIISSLNLLTWYVSYRFSTAARASRGDIWRLYYTILYILINDVYTMSWLIIFKKYTSNNVIYWLISKQFLPLKKYLTKQDRKRPLIYFLRFFKHVGYEFSLLRSTSRTDRPVRTGQCILLF